MFRKTRGLGAKKGAERRKKDGVKDKKQVWIASGHPKKIEPARDRDQLQRVRHEASQEMRVGPSEPAFRSRFQTTSSCMGKEPLW